MYKMTVSGYCRVVQRLNDWFGDSNKRTGRAAREPPDHSANDSFGWHIPDVPYDRLPMIPTEQPGHNASAYRVGMNHVHPAFPHEKCQTPTGYKHTENIYCH